MNRITIGRNPQSTVVVPSSYATVSGNHATITINGNSIILEDHSSNGTYINGQFLHHSSAQIQLGDQILLARQYQLDLNSLLGNQFENTQRDNMHGTTPIANIPSQPAPRANSQPQHQEYNIPNCYDKWSWGAFAFSWIWGVCNGIWWSLLCLLPCIGFILSIVLAVIGNKQAWERYNGTAAEFDAKQSSWNKAALIFFLVVIVLSLITTLGAMA